MPRPVHRKPAGPWKELWREGDAYTYGMVAGENIMVCVCTPSGLASWVVPVRTTETDTERLLMRFKAQAQRGTPFQEKDPDA